MLEFRLKAYRKWLTMEEPDWSDNKYPQIDYNAYYYYSEPKQKACAARTRLDGTTESERPVGLLALLCPPVAF